MTDYPKSRSFPFRLSYSLHPPPYMNSLTKSTMFILHPHPLISLFPALFPPLSPPLSATFTPSFPDFLPLFPPLSNPSPPQAPQILMI